MIGRVALERHLFTVAEAKAVTIEVNPPTKKATAQDAMNSLGKAGVITKIQKSELESLFRYR
jgi:predicted transcriptional regulator